MWRTINARAGVLTLALNPAHQSVATPLHGWDRLAGPAVLFANHTLIADEWGVVQANP